MHTETVDGTLRHVLAAFDRLADLERKDVQWEWLAGVGDYGWATKPSRRYIEAALEALDRAASALPLLHRFREAYGCRKMTREKLDLLEEWASLESAEKFGRLEFFTRDFRELSLGRRVLSPCPLWRAQLRNWLGKVERVGEWLAKPGPSPHAPEEAGLAKQSERGGAGATEGRLYVENIDNFSLVRDVRSSMVAHFLKDGCMNVAENFVKTALEEILQVPFHRKDSCVELDDLYTANVMVSGRRLATAFMLKGPGIGTKVMDIKHCGSRGNQLVRLFDAPAELFVIQFTGRIAEMVVKDVEGKVTARRAQGKPAQFLIMEGQDTARVLYAYGKLKKKRRRSTG